MSCLVNKQRSHFLFICKKLVFTIFSTTLLLDFSFKSCPVIQQKRRGRTNNTDQPKNRLGASIQHISAMKNGFEEGKKVENLKKEQLKVKTFETIEQTDCKDAILQEEVF